MSVGGEGRLVGEGRGVWGEGRYEKKVVAGWRGDMNGKGLNGEKKRTGEKRYSQMENGEKRGKTKTMQGGKCRRKEGIEEKKKKRQYKEVEGKVERKGSGKQSKSGEKQKEKEKQEEKEKRDTLFSLAGVSTDGKISSALTTYKGGNLRFNWM